MGFWKNQLLKVIEWEDNTHDVIAYKYPIPEKTEIMNGSQLIVRPGQTVVLVTGGKVADVFESGRFKLDTGNMPILTKMRSWKYGYNSPFVCDVYFINTKQFISQRWGTSSPVMMRDQDYGAVQFRGYGLFSFRVKDPRVFLEELMGSGASYKTKDVVEQLRRTIVSGVTESVASSNIPALDLAVKYSSLGDAAEKIVAPNFARMGIDLVDLQIENLSLTEESQKALNERTRMTILGNAQEYTAYAAADSMKTVAANAHKGGMGNISGIGMGLGTGTAMAGLYSSTIAGAQNANAALATADAEIKKERARKDDEKREAQEEQANAPVKCPKCGAVNDAKAKFCAECGAKMKATCPKCGAFINRSAKFCPECGERLVVERVCPKCGKVAKAGERFCAACGTRVD